MTSDIKKYIKIINEASTSKNQKLIQNPAILTQMKTVDPAIWSDKQIKKAVIKFVIDGIGEGGMGIMSLLAHYVFLKLKKHRCPWPEMVVLSEHMNKDILSRLELMAKWPKR